MRPQLQCQSQDDSEAYEMTEVADAESLIPEPPTFSFPAKSNLFPAKSKSIPCSFPAAVDEFSLPIRNSLPVRAAEDAVSQPFATPYNFRMLRGER